MDIKTQNQCQYCLKSTITDPIFIMNHKIDKCQENTLFKRKPYKKYGFSAMFYKISSVSCGAFKVDKTLISSLQNNTQNIDYEVI